MVGSCPPSASVSASAISPMVVIRGEPMLSGVTPGRRSAPAAATAATVTSSYVDEVAALSAVLEDLGRLTLFQTGPNSEVTPAYGVWRGIPGP